MQEIRVEDISGDGTYLESMVYSDGTTVYLEVGDRGGFRNVEVDAQTLVDSLLKLFPNLKREIT